MDKTTKTMDELKADAAKAVEDMGTAESINRRGRKRGITNMITGITLLRQIEDDGDDKPFEYHIADGYKEARHSGDRKLRLAYEVMILNKVVADQHRVTIDKEGDMESKASAFQDAMNRLSHTPANVIDITPTETLNNTVTHLSKG